MAGVWIVFLPGRQWFVHGGTRRYRRSTHRRLDNPVSYRKVRTVKKWALSAAIAAGALTFSGQAIAQPSVADTIAETYMYGIDRNNGQLRRYQFSSQSLEAVGTVSNTGGQACEGIDAAGYIPGFANIFALWQDPSDSQNKLLYVSLVDAHAAIVADDLEGGKFTGAVAVNTVAHPFSLFAVQVEDVAPPQDIAGVININPNNSPDNEFQVVIDAAAGTGFSRDQLHNNTVVNGGGTYYTGPATEVRVKPKGNGSQNSLTLNGEALAMQNSNTYTFTGQMQIRVYNDHIHSNGKAMGKWWIEITEGQVVLNNEAAVTTPNRLAKIDYRDGTVTEVMVLSRAYAGLATQDGNVFYAVSGDKLYSFDITAETETEIGTMGLGEVSDLEFVGDYLMAYDITAEKLAPVSMVDGSLLGTATGFGTGKVSPILFAPSPDDPKLNAIASYD